MVKRHYQVEKLPPRKRILPCGDRDCDISTNKRYRGPNGSRPIVACMFSHAEAVYRRNGKAATSA